MATMMIPLELQGIDEGRFLEEFQEALANAQALLCAYVRKYKSDALKAKAVVQVQITLCADRPADGVFSLKAAITTKRPAAPPVLTMAMSGETQEGQPCLLVRSTGGDDYDEPTQLKLSASDGRGLHDPE